MSMATRSIKLLSLSLPSLLLLSLVHSIPSTHAADFTYKNLNDQNITVSHWPAFVLTSRSEADLKDALRCATLVSSLDGKPHWLIDFAWPQPAAIKRRAAKRLLKSDFMKAHSTILKRPTSSDSLVALIDTHGNVLWSSPSDPSDDDWQIALDILHSIRAE